MARPLGKPHRDGKRYKPRNLLMALLRWLVPFKIVEIGIVHSKAVVSFVSARQHSEEYDKLKEI